MTHIATAIAFAATKQGSVPHNVGQCWLGKITQKSAYESGQDKLINKADKIIFEAAEVIFIGALDAVEDRACIVFNHVKGNLKIPNKAPSKTCFQYSFLSTQGITMPQKEIIVLPRLCHFRCHLVRTEVKLDNIPGVNNTFLGKRATRAYSFRN